jgi:GDPmannose 4,6-dehydratase
LIIGIRGQDGRYLAELLYGKGYDVIGMVHDAHPDASPVTDELPFVRVVYGNLTDANSLIRVYRDTEPNEIYNLGAQSAVDLSFEAPLATLQATGIGALNSLEAFRLTDCISRGVRFYQACSSEMFGDAGPAPYSEKTGLNPQSPYAAAKALAYQLTRIYRTQYKIFAVAGICFNHESPRRGSHFVTRKITLAVARIASGLQSTVRLGNLNARRDWGFAGDYVRAMWLAMQHSHADDFVISTGESHSVRDFVELAFSHIGISDWQRYVIQDPRYIRSADPPELCGDSTKACATLDWKPTVSFHELVKMMVDSDLALVQQNINHKSH